MNIQFFDQAPLPKDEVRIKEIELVVYPDRFRVYVHIVVTLFQERPNLLLTARRADGRLAAEASVIESMHHDMEFTLHLRGIDEPEGDYTLTTDLYYETRNPPQDRRVVAFHVPSANEVEEDQP